MKKNILLILASAMLLASCGGSSATAAPTLKEEATVADTKLSAKKALESVSAATGMSASVAGGFSAEAKVTMPGETLGFEDKTVTLNEKVSLSDLSVKEVVAIQDSKLVGSGSTSGKVSASLDMPKFPSMEEITSAMAAGSSIDYKPTIETVSIDNSFTVKDYLQDGKAYLDASGAYDLYNNAITKLGSILGLAGAATGLDISLDSSLKADDLKWFVNLPAEVSANPDFFKNLASSLSAALEQMGEIPESESAYLKTGKFSDGNYGFVFDFGALISAQFSSADSSVAAPTISGKFTLTFSEAGAINAYANVDLAYAGEVSEGVTVDAKVSGSIACNLTIGNVTVEKLSSTEGYKEIELPEDTGSILE